MKYLSTLSLFFLIVSQLWADIIAVPSDQETISDAIEVANEDDTVLVAPGTYEESVTLNGKNLTLASHYLTTGDTSFVSGTVINGNWQKRLINCSLLDSTTTICGFILANGYSSVGGGIKLNNSSPYLNNLIIKNSIADSSGGGIYCRDGSPKLHNVIIENNKAKYNGGGIYCRGGFPELNNTIIKNNRTGYAGGAFLVDDIVGGGGLYCNGGPLTLRNVTVENNRSEYERGSGGGVLIFDANSTVILDSVLIQYNVSDGGGGGIDIYHSDGESIELSATTIRYNKAVNRGGGLSGYFQPLFSKHKLNNIYLNEAAEGMDMWFNWDYPGFSIDTFTVAKPTSYHIACQFSEGIYPVNVNTGVIEQIENDVYVSPDGSNSNSGLSADSPLKTISNTLLKIYADSNNPRTIYLAEGEYKPSDIEFFPLNLPSYITLKGISKEKTILDGLNTFSIIVTNPSFYTWNKISELKIKNGNDTWLGIIYVRGHYAAGDSLFIENVEISNCYANEYILNTLYCYLDIENVDIIDNNTASVVNCASKLSMRNSRITGNKSDYSPGILELHGTSMSIERSIIAANLGTLNNLFISNPPEYSTDLKIINSILGYNIYPETADQSAEIYSRTGKLNTKIINSIVWNSGNNNVIYNRNSNDTLVIAYSDIKGGKDKIYTRGDLIWDEGNISEDPLFADTLNADFSLSNKSPCVNAGTDFYVWNDDTLLNLSPDDYYGPAPDMGAIENTDPTGIKNPENEPLTYKLSQNYPNPFNPLTTITYSIKNQSKVKILIYNVLGKVVTTLIDKRQQPGQYQVSWDASSYASGIYFYQIQAGKFNSVKKMLLIR